MDGDGIPRSWINFAGLNENLPQIIIVLSLILAGGFFAGSETAFSFCSPVRMRMLAEQGDRRASRVRKILDNFDRAIVTLLIAINICYITASSASTVIALDVFNGLGDTAASLLATAFTTVIIFLCAETIPKNIARTNADSYSMTVSLVVTVLMFAFRPLAELLSGIGRLVKRLFRIHDDQPSVTEDEFTVMVEDAGDDGELDEDESGIIISAIDFGDTRAGDIMTERSKITGISVKSNTEEIRRLLLNEKYSRFPVYRGSINNIIGIIHATKALYKIYAGEEFDIRTEMTKAYAVSPDSPVSEVFEGMCARHTHLAIVRDGHGKTLGILSMEDILEEIVGEIYDEDDEDTLNSDSTGGEEK